MLVLSLFGDHLGRPLVRSRVAVTVEDLGSVIAQEGVYFVLAVAPIGIQEIRQVLREPHNRDPFLPSRRLKASILLNREVVRLIFPEKDRTHERGHVTAAV